MRAKCYDAAMEMRALAFTGGNGPKSGFDLSLIPPCDFICAADSGLDTAIALGFRVDKAIGDFDSLRDPALLHTTSHEQLPSDKDITDTEALLQLITGKGIGSYVLVGGGEGRFDHLLHLYSLFSLYGPPEIWITAQEIMYLVRTKSTLDRMEGKTVSVIPSDFRCRSSVSARQLRWPLDDFPIDMASQSISNRCEREELVIEVHGDPVFLSIPFP